MQKGMTVVPTRSWLSDVVRLCGLYSVAGCAAIPFGLLYAYFKVGLGWTHPLSVYVPVGLGVVAAVWVYSHLDEAVAPIAAPELARPAVTWTVRQVSGAPAIAGGLFKPSGDSELGRFHPSVWVLASHFTVDYDRPQTVRAEASGAPGDRLVVSVNW
jgi:hypothetical protein